MVYGTEEGQTRTIVEFIAERARSTGHVVQIADVAAVPAEYLTSAHDAVLLAASIHVGRHAEAVATFVREHRRLLNTVPSAFLSVSLSAAGDDEKQAEAEGYVTAFLEETGWEPGLRANVGGALRYPRYGFLKRLMMKVIAWRGGLPTDTSRDHEFTDWAAVHRFAERFLQYAAAPRRAGGAPPPAPAAEKAEPLQPLEEVS